MRVVGYEVVYGKGALEGLARGAVAGFAWALLYSPVNLGLSAGSLVFCLLGTILRRGIARFTKRRSSPGATKSVSGQNS